jgi:hypothetical protein
MKRIFIPLILATFLYSCEQIKNTKNGQDAPASESAREQAEEPGDEGPDATENERNMEIPDTELGFMVTYEGKYAGQENLFEQEVLAARLKGLDRFNYEAMLERWNTETPIVIEDGVLHMSGCKAHDCPSSAYDFFLDLENDNINIYNFRENMLRIYDEKGWIELPPGFAREMEIKKSNARIGEVDDTESTYSLTTE